MKEFDKYLFIFALLATLTIFGLTGCETIKNWDFSFENKTPEGEVTKVIKKDNCLTTQVFDNENKVCITKKE